MSSIADKEQIKRDMTALGVTLLIHILIAGIFILSHLVFLKDVQEYRGPVLVKLGRAEAPDQETHKQPVIPESTEEQQSISETTSKETKEEVKTGDPEDSVRIDDSKSEKASDIPVSEKENGDRGDSPVSSEAVSEKSSTSNDKSTTEEARELVTVTKGSEEGNAYETTYDASPGIVGRSFGAAIYQYLPVPQFIEKRIFTSLKNDADLENLTADKKRGILSQYYEQYNEQEYILKGQIQPDFNNRPQIWSILAEGGYDLKNPEYKEIGLRPLIITFTVDVGEKATSLSNVQVIRSSGVAKIDEAIIFGFQNAIFSNSSDIPVTGRFTYRFE
jgi:hypothetical protein